KDAADDCLEYAILQRDGEDCNGHRNHAKGDSDPDAHVNRLQFPLPLHLGDVTVRLSRSPTALGRIALVRAVLLLKAIVRDLPGSAAKRAKLISDEALPLLFT